MLRAAGRFSGYTCTMLFSNWVVNQGSNPEFMPVSFVLLCNGVQEMDVPAISNGNRALRSSREFMKMVLVKIRPEFHLMHMVTCSNRNHITGHNCKSMIVRVRRGLGNPDTAKDFMDVRLFFGANRTALMALCFHIIHKILFSFIVSGTACGCLPSLSYDGKSAHVQECSLRGGRRLLLYTAVPDSTIPLHPGTADLWGHAAFCFSPGFSHLQLRAASSMIEYIETFCEEYQFYGRIQI